MHGLVLPWLLQHPLLQMKVSLLKLILHQSWTPLQNSTLRLHLLLLAQLEKSQLTPEQLLPQCFCFFATRLLSLWKGSFCSLARLILLLHSASALEVALTSKSEQQALLLLPHQKRTLLLTQNPIQVQTDLQLPVLNHLQAASGLTDPLAELPGSADNAACCCSTR